MLLNFSLHTYKFFRRLTYYPEPPQEIQGYIKANEIEYIQKDLLKIFDSMNLGTERISNIVLSLRNFSRLNEAGCKTVNIHEGLDSNPNYSPTSLKRDIKLSCNIRI